MLSMYLAQLIAVTFDISTIITLIACGRVKSLRNAILWAIIAALITEFGIALLEPHYQTSYVLALRITVQILIGIAVYFAAQSIRQNAQIQKDHECNNSLHPKTTKFAVPFIMILLLSALLGASVLSLNIKNRATIANNAARHTELDLQNAQITAASEMKGKDSPFLPSAKSHPPKQGDRDKDGNIFLYREPVEIRWNNWTGKMLSTGQRMPKVYIFGEGATAMFEGIVQLNCESGSSYSWRSASNGYGRLAMTEAELKALIPIQVISAAFTEFCIR